MDLLRLPDRSVLAQGILVGIVTYWAVWIIYTRWFHPLAKFPGPFWASITRVWTLLHVLPGNAEKRQMKLHAKYGPVVRIAPNELVTSDPEAIQTLYGTKSLTTKTDFYLAFRPPWARFPDHFSSEGGKQHGERRRIVSHVYTMTSILQSEKYIEKCIDIWLEKLGEMADNKKSFDLWIWTRMYAYDVIGELYFSKMFGFLQAGGDHLGYIDATEDLVPVQFLAANMPTYVRGLFMLTGFLFPKVRRALGALENLTDATNKMLKDHLATLQSDSESESQRQDILSKLLEISHKRGEELDFVLDDVKMESFGAFFAGSETTALTLSGILYHIFRTPRVYAKLTAEIDAAKCNQLSTPRISYNEAVKLPYLAACIKEGIRMHPITGVSFPRHAPSSGCMIGEHYIPGNARIGVNPGVMHFSKTIFGEDADRFRPERWIDGNASRMDRHIMQFGMGARTCLGKNISMCEIYKAIPELLKSFAFELGCDEEM
ncbi:cytochrome P450 [Aspergillus nomiae NRRL 13137]|uniref:Cytochrome P450 n=1 Tax=Aspergillus nomiae NRRL (strain ATCC 15546 / NRRL 13137 / CBS 260.88 / M93) TaxID=1509407 RepID=A0A0L1JBT2_ASPN3|nr:cytochrome P450 [Aspergillus nomiae NRRL 13137]KNG89231.1 cytochrome P450 [Aspergillus nomiae NRRL 13137]